ncbi:hypothetical protein ACXA45_11690, partial [Neomicrococcus lactis]
GTKTGYTTLTKTSAPTTTITPAPVVQVTPKSVVFADNDGTANDTYTIPVTTGVNYQVNSATVAAGTRTGSGIVTVTATAQPGYVLVSGATSTWTHTFSTYAPPPDVSAPAFISSTVTPTLLSLEYEPGAVKVQVRITDATGTAAPVLTMSHEASGQSQGFGRMNLVSGTEKDGTWERIITIPQTAAPGNWEVTLYPLDDVLGNSNGSWFRTLETVEVLTTNKVTPTAVNFTDKDGISEDSYTIPSTQGIDYQINGATVKSGTFAGSGAVTVTAVPQSGYVLTAGATATWSHDFDESPLTLESATPTVTGTTKVGYTLTANPGTWTTGTAFAYQWYRAGVAITGATASTYTLAGADAGKTITVKVTGTKTGYTTVTKTSVATAAVSYGTLTGTTPTITGTKKVGYTLTTNPGTWTSGATLRYQWYRSGVAITGATASTYKLAGADAGKTITVKVTGSKLGYVTVAKTSAATTLIAKGTLVSATPTISGTKKVGYTLTANTGTWTTGTAFTYQWYRSGVAITGATAKTYKPTGYDVGKALTVKVTGSQLGYTTVAKTSVATALIARGTLVSATPTISGTKKVGYTLTANTGTWTYGTTFKYQWYRLGVAITGATAKTYKLTSLDVAKSLTVKVTGSKFGYTTVAKTSAATTLIVKGTLVSPTPTITGTKTVGYTLTANPGTWTYGTTLTYRWYRSGVAITGATAKTYKLTSLDRGKIMTVRVTGTKPGYVTVSKYSAATVAIN